MRRISELDRLEQGEILVCSHLRPAWSIAFARIGGLIAEQGSSLSHGANLARDYGIPAVVNLAQATDLVTDGDWISVDGKSGIVIIQKKMVEG